MGKNIKKYMVSRLWQWLLFGGIALGIAAISSYGVFVHQKSKKITQATEQLKGIAHERSLELLNFIDDQEIKTFDIATAPEVSDAIELLATRNGAVIEKYGDFFERYQKAYDYKDLLLLSREGEIIFSLHNKKLEGIQLNKQPYNKMSLATSFSRSVMTMGVDISDLAFFPPLGQSALYISVPVIKNKQFIGVLAAQINEQALTEIVTNYKDLGRTGELLLIEKKDGEYRFIMPSRNATYSLSFGSSIYESIAVRRAVQGMQGSGVERDYRKKKVIAVWRYLPDVAWGMITKIDLNEVMEPITVYHTLAVGAGVLSLLLLLLSLVMGAWRKLLALLSESRVMRTVIIGAFVVNVIVIGTLLYSYQMVKVRGEKILRKEAENKVEQARETIVKQLEQAEYIAHAIAGDLNAGRLSKEDLEIRMRRDIQENPALVGIYLGYEPYAHNKKDKLFAPAIIREEGGLTSQTINNFYDYTKPEQPGQSITRWYTVPIQQGAGWLEPYTEPTTKASVAAYSVPFYAKGDTEKKKPIGVVSVLYPIQKIKEVVEALGIGKTGYAFAISQDGYFLYHPVSEYVQKQKTIFEVADALNNIALRRIGQRGVAGEKGFTQYLNEITAQYSSVYYEPISSTGWVLAVTFIEEEIAVSSAVWRHYQIWILISSIIAMLLLGLLLTGSYRGKNLFAFSTLSSLTFVTGVILLWVLMYRGYTKEYAQGISIVDKASLHSVIDSINRNAASAHQAPPLAIPTGIYIRSLSFPHSMQTEIAGEVWQHYDTKKHPNVVQGLVFPQSINMEIEERYRDKRGDIETVGWTVKGVISQDFEYSQYPFDVKNVEIALDHPDKTKNILLTPDFESYRLLNPKTKPGIDENVKVLGYAIQKSIFSFYLEKPKVDFGVDEKRTRKTTLNFNIALRRNLIDAIMVFLIPLLVMLFTLYVALWFTYEDPEYKLSYRTLGVYTAVVFTLVMLHRLLREKLPSGEIIYLEYFFFLTYITIALLLLHALVLYSTTRLKPYAFKLSYILRFVYWPAEIFAWLLITIIIFY